MRDLRKKKGQGFSIVEIMIGLTIMSLLVGVTITTFGDSAQRARETIAKDESKAIASAIQRWQLENHRTYPFGSILPLVPRYLKNVTSDPWKSLYRVDSVKKIVYSFGPDGTDDEGGGDDITYFFDTTGDVAPGPPQGLVARLKNSNIDFTFTKPQRNVDGSQPVTDLSKFIIYIRSAQETEVRTFKTMIAVAGPATVSTSQTTATVQVEYGANAFEKSYYFTVRALDNAGNLSGPSNQAGLFVAKEVGPHIVRFRPSSFTPGVGSPFSFSIEVTDADSDLKQVTVKNWPSATPFTAPADIPNPFKFVHNFVPTTGIGVGTRSNIYLLAEDASGHSSQTAPFNITFVNTPPIVTALNPGLFLLTAVPTAGAERTVEFTLEANDQETNLVKMGVDYYVVSDAFTALTTKWSYEWTMPSGAAMVRTTSVKFRVDSVAEFEIRAWAEDSLLRRSLGRVAKVMVKKDTTPPDAVSLSIDRSNLLLTTNPIQGIWFINTPDHILADPLAFDVESPVITYQFKITTSPFGPTTWETSPSVNEAAGTSMADGWFDVVDPPGFEVRLETLNGLRASGFDEEELYYMGVRAMNSSGLINTTTAQPEQVYSLVLQNPFRLDATAPQFPTLPTILGKNDGSQTWIGNVLDAEWEVEDYVKGISSKGLGSGANLFKYRVRRFDGGLPLSGGTPVSPDPYVDWTEIKTKQIFGVTLPSATLADNGLFLQLEVNARDLAGNWRTDAVTVSAKIDFTPPTSPGVPFITNQVAGVIPVLDTFSADWTGAFHDIESGIESYQWGIATTAILPPGALPDVFGWLPAPNAGITNGTISQNNLLTEGDAVHAMVRARNFAGGLSQTVPSTSALVNVSIRTSLDAVPRTGLSPMRVFFTASVDGGSPPYNYTFQFDGTSLRQWKSLSDPRTLVTTYYDYNLSTDPGLPQPEILARLILEDSNGVVSQKDVIIDIRKDVLGAVSFSNHGAIHFFKLDAGGVTSLWTAGVSATSSGTAQFFVEPRGSYLVGTRLDKNGPPGEDKPFHMRIDQLVNRTVPSVTVSGTFGREEPAISYAGFARNQPEGMFLQVHNSDRSMANPSFDGWIQRTPISIAGFSGTDREFAADDLNANSVSFYGAAIDPDNFGLGVVVYDHPLGGGGTAVARIFGGDESNTQVSSPYGEAVGASILSTSLGALASVPGNQPEIGVEVVASRAGYYLVSNNQAPSRVYRIARQGGGFGPVDFITSDGGKFPGDLDVSEDGQFFATLVSTAGSGTGWSVGMGYITSPTFHEEIAAGPGTAQALDMDDGGTRIAVASDNGNVYLLPVKFDVDPPVINVPGTKIFDTNTVLGALLGGGLVPSDVALFRRPNGGAPQILGKPAPLPTIGIFAENDDDGTGDNTALNGDLVPKLSHSFLMVSGVNMDLVADGSIHLRSSGTDCVNLDPDRSAPLPPLIPFGGGGGYVPAVGDIYHFMKVPLGTCGGLILLDGTTVTLEIDWSVGAGTVKYTKDFTMDL
jgi:type II secretory pathway pseudopilin PulG